MKLFIRLRKIFLLIPEFFLFLIQFNLKIRSTNNYFNKFEATPNQIVMKNIKLLLLGLFSCFGSITFAAVTNVTVVQASTAAIPNCGTNQLVVTLQVTTNAATHTLTQIRTNFSGGAAIGAFSNSRVYYTGTTNVFTTANQFGTAVPTVATYNINGSQLMANGVNYFWLVYDLNNTGALATTVDAIISQVTIDGANPAITQTNPAGSRTISMCSAPGGVFSGLETWLRADLGVTGTAPITAWNNQGYGTTTTLQGSPNLQNTVTTYNYNPYVDFVAPAATLNNGLATGRQCVRLNGYNDLTGVSFASLFFAFHTTDLSRLNTHIGTVNGVTLAAPANGTLHGGANGANAAIDLGPYDVTDFGSGSAAGTWQRNGSNIAYNAAHGNTKHILSGVAQTAGTTTLNVLLGGQNDQALSTTFAGHVRDWRGPVGEVIGYRTALTATERQRVHSYLAIKYGITLAQNYLNTAGTTIYTTTAPYNNNIIGIGRDDIETLNQKQSHYDNDQVRIYLSTLAATNAANTGTFSVNNSYVVMGDNNGAHCATAVSLAEMPASVGVNCALFSQLEKEWKVTRTNMAQNYNMDVRLAGCGAPGSVNVAHLRLLVDNDGNFSNGGTTCYYNGDGTGIIFSYTNPVITISGISTTHIPDNATRFITIASINSATPLPVELLEFDAQLNDERTVDLTWSTLSEHNSDYFNVQKLNEQQVWETIGVVDAKGESSQKTHYATIDPKPYLGVNYYRLMQVDNDGVFEFSETRSVALNASPTLLLFPNPAGNFVQLIQEDIADKDILLIDEAGRSISLVKEIKSDDTVVLDTQYLANGVYYVRILGDETASVQKIVIQH